MAGLPTIATWLSTISEYVAVFIRASIPAGPVLRSMPSMAAGSAYPGTAIAVCGIAPRPDR